jgi:RHS repeat-associated protein
LLYTYDPVGNLTHVQDDAQQVIYFRNRRIEPSNDFTYDALYRLIEATGREHLGQQGEGGFLPAAPTSYNDTPRTGVLHPADGNAMDTYRQEFVYDEAGNLLEMAHRRSDPTRSDWRRVYVYRERSLTEPGRFGNRPSATVLHPDAAQPVPEPYAHDVAGNVTGMPHLQAMQWDFKGQLRLSQRQRVNPADSEGNLRHGERTYYAYDAAGQRVRKVTELSSGALRDETVYLDGFEVYRTQGPSPVVRETVHIADSGTPIAMVETRTQGSEPGVPARVIRYQLANHLGSIALELDDRADVISYQEYYPYGGTSYESLRGQNAGRRRYRYTGKERDAESGFYYHGARYYAPWLGRWVSCDRAGDSPGTSPYVYARSNPTVYRDPDGNIPAPYELAGYVPSGPGEQFVSNMTALPHLLADYLTANLPSGDDALSTVARQTGVTVTAALVTTIDVAAGVVASLQDPGLAVRGTLRGVLSVGTGTAAGLEEIDRGNVLSGTAKITAEGAFVVGTAGGGVGLARELGLAGTYQPPLPAGRSAASAPRQLPSGRIPRQLPAVTETLLRAQIRAVRRALGNAFEHSQRARTGIQTTEANIRTIKLERIGKLPDDLAVEFDRILDLGGGGDLSEALNQLPGPERFRATSRLNNVLDPRTLRPRIDVLRELRVLRRRLAVEVRYAERQIQNLERRLEELSGTLARQR